ncbi:hypothetical protein FOA52_008720 [Chlamydomonas sp. UWO 241]|nr:hypothetical protein FOA52_008720 [Chlamydomonas sp. UWO 241]
MLARPPTLSASCVVVESEAAEAAAGDSSVKRGAPRQTTSMSQLQVYPQQPAAAALPLPVLDADARMLVLKMTLKCADLGHLTSAWGVHLEWVKLLQEEMFFQGDREALLGQAVSPLMDRTKAGVTKSQCGFFNFVAIPMFTNFVQAFPGASEMLSNLKANHACWAEKEAAAHVSGANAVAPAVEPAHAPAPAAAAARARPDQSGVETLE